MEIKNKETIDNLLGYDGLKIIQSSEILNFSLDSCLLSYFVTINKSDKKIIDLGCGNGYIPLFLSLRSNAYIYGVEIQEKLYDMAKRSVEINNLMNQISIINGDLNDIYKSFGPSSFDVVVSNPPYFKVNDNHNFNNNDYKTIARHEVLTNLDKVCRSASILLKEGGTFAIVHRSDRLVEIFETFKKYSIEPKRLEFVYNKINDESVAILIEGKKTKKCGGLKIMPPLYIKDSNNNYTKEILNIFNYKRENDVN